MRNIRSKCSRAIPMPLSLTQNRHSSPTCFAPKLDGVPQEILEQLGELRLIPDDGRQVDITDDGAALLYRHLEVGEGMLEGKQAVNRLQILAERLDPRI